MDQSKQLLHAFETHDAGLIRTLIAGGLDPNAPIDGRAPIDLLIEMYMRSGAFPACVTAMLDGGATIGDALLRAILLDDDAELRLILAADPHAATRRLRLACSYVSLDGVTPLHLCAEYNAVRCGRTLLGAGADVDARGDVQLDGTGGHTPIFHAVNSNFNHCRPMMELLAGADASLDLRVDALLWGGGFDWETVFFDVTPIAFAQAGLYPQVHRRPEDVYDNVSFLYAMKNGGPPPIRNVPNKYLG